MKIIRKKLEAADLVPPYLRYNPSCDCVEQTPDGGTTWVENPSADPRHADGFRLPPLTGDARCDAAARIVAAWQDALAILYQSVNAAQFATGILGILLVLAGGAGILIDLIILVGEVLIAAGISNIEAAFTSEVWDGILCIVYEHIGEDGQVSAAQAAAILSQISSQYGGLIYNVLAELEGLFGEVLMSNATVERDETGDCDTCGTFCAQWFLNAEFTDNIDLDAGDLNGYEEGKYRLTADLHEGSQNWARCLITIPSGVTVTRIRVSNSGEGEARLTMMLDTDVWDGNVPGNSFYTSYIYLNHDVAGEWGEGTQIGFSLNSNYPTGASILNIRMDWEGDVSAWRHDACEGV